MPTVTKTPNPFHGTRQEIVGSGTLAVPEVYTVQFDPGELKEIEIVHARGLSRSDFSLLIRIAKHMRERKISYREAYLELRDRGEA